MKWATFFGLTCLCNFCVSAGQWWAAVEADAPLGLLASTTLWMLANLVTTMWLFFWDIVK